ncbi:hypothetical protein [Sediminibacillus massiliensis]|uniref:hypothetical protein n=1 Tax=Sediminibacillus massiliensis TaxID=1926277 RepID=UPI0009883342|nr:hypothetical protein [Sediminibacillus massiliensis]
MDIAWNGSQIKIRLAAPVIKPVVKEEPSPMFIAKVNNKEAPIKLTKLQPKQQQRPKYSTFQIIPHSNVKNIKVGQFADSLADTYEELIKRFNKGLLRDPDRIFFETEITNSSYRTFITTNTDLTDVVKQQSQVIWKHVTLQDEHKFSDQFPKDSLCLRFKLKYPFFLSLKTDRAMQQIPLEELLEISRFMQRGDKAFIQFGFQSAEEEWFKDAERDRNEFEKKPPKHWIKKEFSKATELKPGNFGFDFTLRVVVQSKDERRRRRIARGISLALKQLNHDNQLKEKLIKPRQTKRFFEDIHRRHIPVPFLFGKRQIITSPEISHFIKLPQRALQEEYPIIETVDGREIDIPDAIKKDGMELGTATFKGKKQPVYMPIKDHDELCLPRIVVGGMGQGKTKGFGSNWIVNAVDKGFGAMAIDPAKGEIGDGVQKALPADKIIRVRLGEIPISLDWCEVAHSSRAKNRLANTIIGFFNTATDEAGAQTARYLRAAVMGMRSGKLKEIIDIFTKEKERICAIINLGDNIYSQTLIQFHHMSDKRQAQILAPIMNRLDTILGDEYLSSCMESDQSIDMVELMSQRKAVIIDVPKKDLGSEAVDLIVNLLSTKIDLAMTLREEKNQFPFFVVFDEPHQFLRSAKTWKAATVESRKWRVGYVWMFHSWEQIPRDLAEIVKAAGPHYHLYPSSKKTFSDLAEEIKPFKVEEAMGLKRFHAINILRSGGEVVKPFVAKMSAPPEGN